MKWGWLVAFVTWPAFMQIGAGFVFRVTHFQRRLKVLPMNAAWSRYVEVDSNGSLLVKETADVAVGDVARTFKLSSPREWLEFCESENESIGGAYTVLRCDLLYGKTWEIWEKEFHLLRLCQSYRSLSIQLKETEQTALIHTDRILSKLLTLARDDLKNRQPNDQDASCVVMITLLWQQEKGKLVVRGHAFSDGNFERPRNYNPAPITASLATNGQLPDRYDAQPRAKLSSWCRVRRPLEEQLKPQDVGEVLLTEENNNQILLLEGLTSNLFVMYGNGTLLTADTGVLEGCARNLVIKSAKRLGWSVACGRVPLDDIDEWQEVFVTSSVRLVCPVQRIVIIEGGSKKTLWKSASNRKWRELYDAIIDNMC